MPHLNAKPLEKYAVYETEAQAINHVLLYKVFSARWSEIEPLGRFIADRRAIDAAIKNNDASAFQASRRRGYWRVELKKQGKE